MKNNLKLLLERLKKSFALKKQESRLALIFGLSFLISFFIFYIMSVLISSGKNIYGKNSEDANIYFLMDESIEDLELRDRRRPKEPKKEEAPPETPKLKVQQTEIQKPDIQTQPPKLELPTDFSSDGIGVGQSMSQNREVIPIFRINPNYPRQAALRQIEGFVILQFDITMSGETDNISILQASPPQIFNSSAIQALKRWKYKPKLEDGKPVRQNHLKVQLDFKLEN